VTEVAAAYSKSLQKYLGGAGESALQQAYEIGRGALNAGIGLVAIADIHHAYLRKLLAQTLAPEERERILTGAAQFFAECVSPYEMTYGGFREANTALRHFKPHYGPSCLPEEQTRQSPLGRRSAPTGG